MKSNNVYLHLCSLLLSDVYNSTILTKEHPKIGPISSVEIGILAQFALSDLGLVLMHQTTHAASAGSTLVTSHDSVVFHPRQATGYNYRSVLTRSRGL